ncbi:MAG: hypothetical protein ABIR52_04400, partial [Casimicrobiaceae bacterium]
VRERVGDAIFTIARDRSVDADFLVGLVATLAESGAFPLFTMPRGTISIDTSGLSVQQAVAAVDSKINHSCSAPALS